jgi:hypothetical protein
MDTQDPEDRFIRNLVILASTGAVMGILAAATAITVMVSANFNILNWME